MQTTEKNSDIAGLNQKFEKLQNDFEKLKDENSKMLKYISDALTDPYMGRLKLMLHNANVPQKYDYIFYKLKPGAVCIDCGANIGLITDIFNHLGGTVHAFEPHADLYNFLKFKFQNNPNIFLYPKAILDRNGTIPFLTCSVENVNYLGCSQGATVEKFEYYGENAFESKYDVETVDLCEFIENNFIKNDKRIYVLKIDIEGSEFPVLEKLIRKELYKNIDYIFCETHERLIDNGQEKMNNLKKLVEQKGVKNIYFDWI